MINGLKLNIINSIRARLDKWEEKLIAKKDVEEKEELTKLMYKGNQKILFLDYYENLLRNNKRILYFIKDLKEPKRRFIQSCMFANCRKHQPVILVASNKKFVNSIIWNIRMFYKLEAIKYSKIESLREIDTIDKAFFFSIEEMGFHYALEQAMILNKKLLSIGLTPLIIVESFEMFYKREVEDEFDEYLDEYLDEVFYENIDNMQNVVLISDGIYNKPSTMSMKRVNYKLINSLDVIIYGPEYLKNAYIMFNEKKALNDTLKDFENQDVAEALKPVLNNMMLTGNSLIYSGFVINPRKMDLEELKIYTGD